jgi:carboxylesterase type B
MYTASHFLITVGLLQAFSSAVISTPNPSVSITLGEVRGGQCEGNSSVSYFKSIPYAQPPTGDLRFAPPESYNTKYSNGTLQATSAPPSCIQYGDEFVVTTATSEDW